MNKAEISGSYLEEAKLKHAGKVVLPDDCRTALVTGAESPDSIGRAIVEELTLGRKFMEVQWPSRDMLEVASTWHIEKYLATNHYADTLVLCHGVTHLDWIEDQPDAKINEVLNSNLTGSIRLVSHWSRMMLDRPERKQLVFIGSMAHSKVLNASAPYCAAKAGLAHFAKCIAWELAPKGFDVFTVHPSNTSGTPMTRETVRGIARMRGVSMDEAWEYWGATNTQKRWLAPSDIAETVSWLLRDMPHLSGTSIELAGGQR